VMKEAAEKINEQSGGRIQMTVYPNNQLGDSVANFQQMQENGSVQMGEMSAAAMTSFSNLYTPYSLPFLFKNKEQCFNYFDNSEQQKEVADKFCQDTGVRILAWFYNDTRTLTNSKREIKTPDDMKGLKIRAMQSDVYIKTFEALGASPISMSFAEVFTGLQQGAIDGQDNGIVLTVSQKFHEVQKYYTDLNHVIDMAPILVSEEFYQSLPDDLKQILTENIQAAAMEERSMYKGEELNEIAKYCKITNLTDEERAVFKEKCQPVYDWYRSNYTDIDLDAIIAEVDKS
jgi:tripartite ATP-independent transporter DctP family solute receptor